MPKRKTGATDGDGIEQHRAQAAGSQRGRAQAAGHDGVFETHRHPAQFGQRQRNRHAQHGCELGTQMESLFATRYALG